MDGKFPVFAVDSRLLVRYLEPDDEHKQGTFHFVTFLPRTCPL